MYTNFVYTTNAFITMKTKILILLCFAALWGCKKEKPDVYTKYLRVDFPYGSVNKGEIKIFGFEKEFYNDKFSKTDSVNGGTSYLLLDRSTSNVNYWFKITSGKFNSKRCKVINSAQYDSEYTSCPDRCERRETSVVTLSLTPTRLQLNVFENGVAVSNAIVKVYLREEDYQKNQQNPVNYFDYDKYVYPEAGNSKNSYGYDMLTKTTDTFGTVLFENFEPRLYWFRVEKGSKNNSSTRFSTMDSLPDDENVTTVLDIGIK